MNPANPFAMARLAPHSEADFVSTDQASLASHMHGCARSKGRFFSLRTSAQVIHAVVASRIVTVALCAVVAVGLLALL
jgi:hypothetical protein